ncbi:hypothetical protein ANCCAN_00863 [Ancylostoma caninum]|uniref:Uncharacterized protein n=1 Tax=Ancylostoma caninum TaxID=29170 RepID=A0A368HAZ5_ANCCA|nr:hypothetical protein ANCCAN_00863 [Ancylostoma caninum]
MIIGTVAQALVTLVIFGLFIFFMVEIFISHSLVYNVLVYIKSLEESKRVAAARDCSIVMAIDSLITGAIHLWTLHFCIKECRVENNQKQEKQEKEEKQEKDEKREKPAETFRFAERSWAMLENALAHLRFRDQTESHPTESPIAAIAIHTELEYPQMLEIPRLRTTSQGEISGADPDKIRFSDRHRSMPPPSRQHRSGSTQHL